MKINLWGINYAPELTGIGVYSTGLAEYLASVGDSVTVVTGFPYYPQWRLLEKHCTYKTLEINGVKVCRCPLFVPGKPTPILRILHEASFVVSSFLRQLTLPADDIYVVVSPPLLLGFAAWLVSVLKNRPFIFHVQDMQPDAAAGLSMLKEGPFLKLLYKLEMLAYDKASRVSAISKEMCSLIAGKGVPAEKIILFPNWISADYAKGKRGDWKTRMGIDAQTKLVSYAGNFGVKQGLSVIPDAAKLLLNKPFAFVIAGNGAERESLQKQIADGHLTNVRMLDVLPEEEHTGLIFDSDICLIPQKRGAETAFLPSKLLKILALDRPVIAVTQNEGALASAILEGGFGLRIDPDDPQELANVLTRILEDQEKLREMSVKAGQYIRQYVDVEVLSAFKKQLVSALEGNK